MRLRGDNFQHVCLHVLCMSLYRSLGVVLIPFCTIIQKTRLWIYLFCHRCRQLAILIVSTAEGCWGNRHVREKLPKPFARLAGANTIVRKAIVDKNARIGSNVRITNEGNIKEANREDLGFVIKDGIVVVIKDSIIPNGTVI